MSNRFKQFIEQSKQELSRANKALRHEFKTDSVQGIIWWAKSYKQNKMLPEAIEALKQQLTAEDFDLKNVYDALIPFKLKYEDEGRLDWFVNASNNIQSALEKLSSQDDIDATDLADIVKELSFLRQEDSFYEYFNLLELQVKVNNMYKELLQRVDELKSFKAKKLEIERLREETAKQEQKLKLITEANKKRELENQKIEALKQKAEADRANKVAAKKAHEAEMQRMEVEREFKAKQAEEERIKALQQSYTDLSYGSTKPEAKTFSATAKDLLDILNQQPLSTEDAITASHLKEVLQKQLDS